MTATRASTAVGFVVFGVALFAIADALTKIAIETASLWQMQVLRSALISLLLAAPAALFGRWAWIQLTSARWPAIRASLLSVSYVMFYAGLPFLTISQAAAALYTTPLFVTVFAAVLLREEIGPRRIFAVALGFAGVALIVRPDADALRLATFLPLGAAAFYALAIIVTRARCLDEPAGGLALAQSALFGVIGAAGLAVVALSPLSDAAPADDALVFLVRAWQPVDFELFTLIAAISVASVIGLVVTAAAYQWSDVSRIAPFEYAYLIFALLLDFAVWGQTPSATAAAGMALIALAGGFVAWREGRPPRPTVHTHGEDPWMAPTAETRREQTPPASPSPLAPERER